METECHYCGGRTYRTGEMGSDWRGRSCPRCKVLWSNQHGLMVRDKRWKVNGQWKVWMPVPDGVLVVGGEREDARAIGRPGLSSVKREAR